MLSDLGRWVGQGWSDVRSVFSDSSKFGFHFILVCTESKGIPIFSLNFAISLSSIKMLKLFAWLPIKRGAFSGSLSLSKSDVRYLGR